MNFLEAVETLKNPNDKFNLDLIAIRIVVLELLKREEKPVEILTNDEPKKGKMKKLAMIIAMLLISTQAFAGVTYNNGRKIVSNAGTAEALSAVSAPYKNTTICAETDNTGVIVLGGVGVIASQATRTGVPLTAGDCKTYNCDKDYICGDLANIYADATVNGDGVTFEYIKSTIG